MLEVVEVLVGMEVPHNLVDLELLELVEETVVLLVLLEETE